MRVKHVAGAEERIAESAVCLSAPEQYKGHWRELFPGCRQLILEIGCGKGQFLIRMAAEQPDCGCLGLEKIDSVLLRAVEKLEQEKLPNMLLMRRDAEQLTEIFAEGELDAVYLNFSDPWPKKRHEHRRLTAPGFLSRYRQVLSADGFLQFKTDNRDLFDWSVRQFEAEGWIITGKTEDLHRSPSAEGNITTEYEDKFAAEGKPICFLRAVFPPDKPAVTKLHPAEE